MLCTEIGGLLGDRPSGPGCLSNFSRLFRVVGNEMEHKWVLTHTEVHRPICIRQLPQCLDDLMVVTLLFLMPLFNKGKQQAEEASESSERFGDAVEQTRCLVSLALPLCRDKQLGATEEAASRAISLLPEKGEEFQARDCHQTLDEITRSKGETGKAIHRFEAVPGITISFNWLDQPFWANFFLVLLFFDEDRLYDAHAQVERAKSYTADDQ